MNHPLPRLPYPFSDFDYAQHLPPLLVNGYAFIHHFVLFFLVPVSSVAFTALVAASIARSVHRQFIARYATPEELLENALAQLKRIERRRNPVKEHSYASPINRSRRKALQTLRLVIQLRPDMIDAYVALGTELFYGDMQDKSGERKHAQGTTNNANNVILRRRAGQSPGQQQHDITDNYLSPALIECKDVVARGLCIDNKNKSLLNLQSELELVVRYGHNGSHAKMINIGSFGWMNN